MKTRMTADFAVNNAMKAWAESRAPIVNIEAETEKFIDHWLGKGEPMEDWTACWRTWMRNALTFRGAIHYTADELAMKKLVPEFTAAGFRAPHRHENSNMYRFEYEVWRSRNVPQRDMSCVTQLVAAKRT